jgi:hypothetical protein
VHLTCLVQPRDDARLAADVESAERVLGSNAATFDRGDAYYARVLCSMIHPRTGQITASDEVLLANNDIVAYLRCALTLRASVSPTTTATSTSTMTPMTRRTLFRALLQRPAVVAAINSLSQGDLAALFYAVDDTRVTSVSMRCCTSHAAPSTRFTARTMTTLTGLSCWRRLRRRLTPFLSSRSTPCCVRSSRRPSQPSVRRSARRSTRLWAHAATNDVSRHCDDDDEDDEDNDEAKSIPSLQIDEDNDEAKSIPSLQIKIKWKLRSRISVNNRTNHIARTDMI